MYYKPLFHSNPILFFLCIFLLYLFIFSIRIVQFPHVPFKATEEMRNSCNSSETVLVCDAESVSLSLCISQINALYTLSFHNRDKV